MISYADFRKVLKRELWPTGEALSLVEAHNKFFLEAMIDLCKWIPCLQQNHTDVFPACSTYVSCGLTLFEAPYGVVQRVYTIANNDWCSKVYYDPSNYNRVANWSSRLLRAFQAPANAGMPALQQGIKYAESSTDAKTGRSRSGIWAIHRKRMHIAPWVQSNESVVVEWDGVKTDWKDEDMLDETYWTPDVAAAVKKWVQWSHQRDFGIYDTAPGEERVSRGDYEADRADLIFWCNERTKEQEPKVFVEGSALPTAEELKAEAVPESTPGVFAVIGDFGSNTDDELAVSELVKGWDPEYIVTLGDNWYGSQVTLSDLDLKVGKYYQEFLHPYVGSYGDGASEQRMFAAIGNHDRAPSGRLELVMQYFNLSKPYYDVVKGPIHFFIVDTGYDNSQVNQQADGVTESSVQGQWLQAMLALSTARFKVVVMHHTPYTSTASSAGSPLAGDGTLSYPALRWPLKDWGADILLNGHAHNFERLLLEDGFPIIVAGAGGQPGSAPEEPAPFRATPLSQSVIRYNEKFGALKCSVDCGELTFEFIAADGTVVDSFSISK